MKKILFIVSHRMNRSPGQRFRFEQYFDHLRQNNYEITFSNIISEKNDKVYYSKGNYFRKFIILLKSLIIRLKDIYRASDYDIIFIYRESIMLGSSFFELMFKRSGTKIVFDFDDAIWLNDVSDGNTDLKWLKKPSKTSKIIKISDLVFAGNKYLADYALKYNKNVKIIPTTIDTSYHKKSNSEKAKNAVCIGWTGTSTTLKHFEHAIPFLIKLRNKYQSRIYFKIIVDFPYKVNELDLTAIEWKLDSEIEELSEFDIGIMPLPDDEWTKGKCGFKGLQYMAMEIPTVMSPVGVNSDIIINGENGFLAFNEEDWIDKLSQLIENPDLRFKLGRKGLQTVIEKYSVESQKNNYLKFLNELQQKCCE
jgi:glycosyltransferase involved in cell wall biosynthesis